MNSTMSRNYKLVKSGKIVYYGETNNINDRKKQHESERKVFDKIVPVGSRTTKKKAQEKEASLLKNYRKTHGYKNPKYNKTKNG